jgi:hypothetical protein
MADGESTVWKAEVKLLGAVLGIMFVVLSAASGIIYNSMNNRISALETKVEGNSAILSQLAVIDTKQKEVYDQLSANAEDRVKLWTKIGQMDKTLTAIAIKMNLPPQEWGSAKAKRGGPNTLAASRLKETPDP